MIAALILSVVLAQSPEPPGDIDFLRGVVSTQPDSQPEQVSSALGISAEAQDRPGGVKEATFNREFLLEDFNGAARYRNGKLESLTIQSAQLPERKALELYKGVRDYLAGAWGAEEYIRLPSVEDGTGSDTIVNAWVDGNKVVYIAFDRQPQGGTLGINVADRQYWEQAMRDTYEPAVADKLIASAGKINPNATWPPDLIIEPMIPKPITATPDSSMPSSRPEPIAESPTPNPASAPSGTGVWPWVIGAAVLALAAGFFALIRFRA